MYHLLVVCFLLFQSMTAYGCCRRGRTFYNKGEECTPCGAGCQDGTCDDDGSCSCRPRWTGRGCTTRCTTGYVQRFSCIRCGSGCQGGRCDADDGTCRCKPGWAGSRCTSRCPGGYFVYGRTCRRCSSKCSSRRCDVADGSCNCISGWAGRRCTIKLAITDGISTRASSRSMTRSATTSTKSTKAGTPSTKGDLRTLTPVSWSSTDLPTQRPTNWSSTDLKPGEEQPIQEDKSTWTYVLIYSLISCASLVLCLVLKRRRARTSGKTSGVKVPSTAEDLGSDQAVYFTAVPEGYEDRHYDAIQDSGTQVGVSHDEVATITEENMYEIPSDNECDKMYENISKSNDGNLYESPSVKRDRHIYEGLQTKISKN